MAETARQRRTGSDYSPVRSFEAAVLTFQALLTLAAVMPLRGNTFSDLASRAAAARKANHIAAATELYREALKLNPRWQEGWWFQGNLLYGAGQFAAARDSFERLVQLNPGAAPAVAMLGLCEFKTGNYEKALSDIETGLRSPASRNQKIEQILRYYKAVLLTRQGKFDQAFAEYGWFARHGIKSDPVFAGIGLAALRAPLLPKEISAGQAALYMTTGKVGYAILAGDTPDANVGMRWLLKQFPQAHNLHYLYGWFLMGSDPEAAIGQFRKELAMTPGSGAANAMLAWTLLNWGESRQALPYAKAAVKLEPRNETAQYVLGQALVGQGQVEAGIEHLQLAAKANPADAKPHISLATAFWRAGKPQDARRERELAVRLSKEAAPGPSTTNGNLE